MKEGAENKDPQRLHQTLDNKILLGIKGGCHHFLSLNNLIPGQRRVLDRRLQYLRKRGFITYDGPKKGWRVL